MKDAGKAAPRPSSTAAKRGSVAGGQITRQSSSLGRVVRLSDPEMKESMDALKARIKSDPEYAKALLQQAGILTATGRLTKRFGGA